jgi:hypothetical protein
MKWEVLKTHLEPIGRGTEDTMHWHRAVMRVVGIVEAATAESALQAARKAGHLAPVVKPADDAAAARFTAKIRSMARPARAVAEVA